MIWWLLQLVNEMMHGRKSTKYNLRKHKSILAFNLSWIDALETVMKEGDTMKKKLLGIVIIVIVLISMLSIYGKYIRQYNSQGISLRPCITIDVDCPEEFVCEVSGFKVYEVNLEEVYFINVKAEEVS